MLSGLSWAYRFIGVVSALAWCVSLLLPAYVVQIETTLENGFYYGYDCLLIGWFAALSGATYGWLANPLWFWTIYRLLRGRPPTTWVALAAAALALTALLPFDAMRVDDHVNSGARPQIGAVIWASAVCAPLAGALLSLLSRIALKQSDAS